MVEHNAVGKVTQMESNNSTMGRMEFNVVFSLFNGQNRHQSKANEKNERDIINM